MQHRAPTRPATARVTLLKPQRVDLEGQLSNPPAKPGRQSQRRHQPSDVDRPAADHLAGHSLDHLAVEFGVHCRTVAAHLDRRVIPRRVYSRKTGPTVCRELPRVAELPDERVNPVGPRSVTSSRAAASGSSDALTLDGATGGAVRPRWPLFNLPRTRARHSKPNDTSSPMRSRQASCGVWRMRVHWCHGDKVRSPG